MQMLLLARKKKEGGAPPSLPSPHYVAVLSATYPAGAQTPPPQRPGLILGASIENSQAESCGQACLDITEAKNFGSKSNDLGSKLTAFSVLNFVSKQQLLEMIK